MRTQVHRPAAIVMAWTMLWFAAHGNLRAQEQIVPEAQFHTELQKAAQTRQGNLDATKGVLATDVAREQLRTARLEPGQVREAVSQLGDAELARLAQMARAVDADLAGGFATGLIVLVAILAAVAVILVVWIA